MTITVHTFQNAVLNIGNGLVNLSTHSFKLMYLNGYTFSAGDARKADIAGSEISAAGGYVAGGFLLNSVTWSATPTKSKFDAGDSDIIVAGNSWPAFNGMAVYDDTSADDLLLIYIDLGQTYNPAANDELITAFGADGLLAFLTG